MTGHVTCPIHVEPPPSIPTAVADRARSITWSRRLRMVTPRSVLVWLTIPPATEHLQPETLPSPAWLQAAMAAGPGDPSPVQLVEIALLRLTVANGFAPVTDAALADELAGLSSDELKIALDMALRDDVARHVPEGWVLRGHGPRTASSRHRLLGR